MNRLACVAITVCYWAVVVKANETKPLPSEYRVVANYLSHDLKPSPKDFQKKNKDMTAIIAEIHSAIMDLREVKSTDKDLLYIAKQGDDALTEAIKRIERLKGLPKPQDLGSLIVESFIHGLFGNVYAGYALGTDADKKQKAILDEIKGLAVALEKADAIHLLLPKVAERYAAPISPNRRIKVDFNGSWYGLIPNDWIAIYNAGDELEDCTIVVEMRGADGEIRKNVHFVPKWSGNSWLYGCYSPGTDLDGCIIGKMKVENVETVEVTILSPKFSTKVSYTYHGAERDKDIAECCKNITLGWEYLPFEMGVVFPDTQRGIRLTLTDYPYLGKCRVTVTFKRGNDSKSWYWNLDSWKKNEEKTFRTPAGGLKWDPETVEVVLSFPRTDYKHIWVLKVK